MVQAQATGSSAIPKIWNVGSTKFKKSILLKPPFLYSILFLFSFFCISLIVENSFLSDTHGSGSITCNSWWVWNYFSDRCIRSKTYALLNDTWTSIYGLNQTAKEIQKIDIQDLLYNATVPPAPHLQNCPLFLKRAFYSEKCDSKTGYPDWALDSQGPKPPWIRGSDEDNLPLTRLVQRDIWINQNPLNCQSPKVKFIIANWTTTVGHGIGSQLHVMAMLFSVSLAANRVFIPFPDTFFRANSPDCHGISYQSLNCYFAPIVPRACILRAMKYFNRGRMKTVAIANRAHLVSVLNAEETLIHLKHHPWQLFLNLYNFPESIQWPKYAVTSPFRVLKLNQNVKNQPWNQVQSYMELEKKEFYFSNIAKSRMWLLSQVVRYMLRWPSLHLCHVMNIERHNVYGRHVIERMIKTRMLQSKIDMDEELKDLGGFEAKGWLRSDPQFLRGLTDEPYLPRPIVSIHVRQGDKAIEMKLFSFETHMYFANKLQYHEPELKYAWLSTEMQDVVDESKSYPSWKFFYSDLPRQHGDEKMHEYEQMVGRSRFVDLSFINLMIASECDYFVGTLGSNWNLLINELRMTNGRMKSKYLTMNIFEELFRD